MVVPLLPGDDKCVSAKTNHFFPPQFQWKEKSPPSFTTQHHVLWDENCQLSSAWIQIWIEIPNGRILQPCSRLQPQFKRLHYPLPFSSSDEGAANFAGYRDFCRLLKFSPISQQWHVLPKIFVFSFFASNPDDETDQGLTGGKVVKSTNLQHSKVAIPSSRCHYCLLWNIDNCNFIYDDRILKIGNRFSLHFSQVILISWPTSSLTQCRTQCRTQWPTKTDQACQQHCQLSSANMFFSCPSSSRLGCTKNSKKFSKPHGLLVYFVATWV